MGTRMCGNVGAVDKEKTSLHVLNVPETDLHNPDQISRGGPFLPKKWVLGDHFSTENFGPGDQNFQDQNSGDRTTPCATHPKWKINQEVADLPLNTQE